MMIKSEIMKHFFGIIIVIVLMLTPVIIKGATDNPEEWRAQFEKANRLYDDQEYEEARAAYEALLEQGAGGAALLYNFGNACARTGDSGAAVLYYLRALRKSPRDSDIRQNLERIQPVINRKETFFLFKPLAWVKNRLSLNEWTILGSVFFIAGCLALGLSFVVRKFSFRRFFRNTSLTIFILFAVIACFLGLRVYEQLIVQTAVVMQENTIARSGPGEQFEELYELPAGTRVRIISKPRNEWVRIRLPNGKSGYLPLAEMKKVSP